MGLLQSSTLSNQNISSALLVGTYTLANNRTSVICQVLANQVAGNGLYTVYSTRQIGGTGAAYEYQGRATVLVESGVTAIAFPSIVIPALANDVIRVYLVGLAGDTTTPDIICEFWDLGFLSPTVADRTLDVSATGEAGVDWANVGSPTTTVGLSGTTVGSVTNITNNHAKYMNGAVWVNTVTGATGTTNYTNGIMTNPSNSLPNAKTIADSLNLKKFWIQALSSIALSADMIGYVLDGASWTLSSASARNISGTTIRGCENLTGTYTSPTQACYVYECQVGTSTWGEVDFHICHITGTITLNAALPFLFDRCVGIPANSPTVNFGAVADARSAVVGDYGGTLTITNMRAGNVLNIDGDCVLTIDASCTGGTVYINGNIALTNNGTGLTIYDTSRYGEDQAVASVTGAVGSVTAGVTVSDKTGYSLTAAYDAAKTAASQASVDALPTTAPDNASITAIKAKTDNLPSDPADESLLEAAITAATSPLATASALATVDSNVSAIKTKTDAFPASVASPSDVTNAKLDIIAAMPTAPDNAGIAAIKAKTDNLPSDPADESLLEALIGDIVRNPVVAVSATVAASVSSGALGLQTYYTFRQAVTSTVTDNLASASKLWLAIKKSDRADSEALILLEKTSGLTVVNKTEYATPGDGSLSVTGTAGDWEITIDLDEAATGLLSKYHEFEFPAEIKAMIAGDTICVWSGTCAISAGIVRSYS